MFSPTIPKIHIYSIVEGGTKWSDLSHPFNVLQILAYKLFNVSKWPNKWPNGTVLDHFEPPLQTLAITSL